MEIIYPDAERWKHIKKWSGNRRRANTTSYRHFCVIELPDGKKIRVPRSMVGSLNK